MKAKIFFHIVLVLFACRGFSQAPLIEWQVSLGGPGSETLASIISTSEGGYLAIGTSTASGGLVSNHHAQDDIWVVKMNASGSIEWEHCYGGAGIDRGVAVKEAPDGRYIICGSTTSNNANVSGNHGDMDYWVAKITQSGNLIWQHCLGGSLGDWPVAMYINAAGEIFVAGNSISTDGDRVDNGGAGGYWIIKLDIDGNLIWEKSPSEDSQGMDYCQFFNDGSFAIPGTRDYVPFTGSNDYREFLPGCGCAKSIMKFDASGVLEWESFQGAFESFYSGVGIPGGYLFAGSAPLNASCGYFREGEQGNHGQRKQESDAAIEKLDADGNPQWVYYYGGSSSDGLGTVEPTADNGYVLCGSTSSSDCNVSFNYGSIDIWVLKVNCEGEIVWEETLGGSLEENAKDLLVTEDGGFLIAGSTSSFNGQVTQNYGGSDFWLVKLEPETFSCNAPTNPFASDINLYHAKLNWDIQDCAFGYKVQYRAVGATSWITKTINSNTGYKNINGLLPGTSYQWKVRTTCTAKPFHLSAYCPVQTFSTPMRLLQSLDEISNEEDEYALTVFPNPSTQLIKLQIEGYEGVAELILINLLGELVTRQSVHILPMQNTVIEVSNIPSGFYIARLMGSKGTVEGSFIKQ